MTPDDIARIAAWREPDEARFPLFVPVFGQAVEFRVCTKVPGEISARGHATIRDVVALRPDALARIKALIWENCVLCCEGSSYGFDVPEGRSETEANFANFGVHDAQSAYEQCSPPIVSIYEIDHADYAGNYAHITFDNAWESHLMTVIVRNGVVVGGGESGIRLGQFEPRAEPGA
jgi:hypothetical protein